MIGTDQSTGSPFSGATPRQRPRCVTVERTLCLSLAFSSRQPAQGTSHAPSNRPSSERRRGSTALSLNLRMSGSYGAGPLSCWSRAWWSIGHSPRCQARCDTVHVPNRRAMQRQIGGRARRSYGAPPRPPPWGRDRRLAAVGQQRTPAVNAPPASPRSTALILRRAIFRRATSHPPTRAATRPPARWRRPTCGARAPASRRSALDRGGDRTSRARRRAAAHRVRRWRSDLRSARRRRGGGVAALRAAAHPSASREAPAAELVDLFDAGYWTGALQNLSSLTASHWLIALGAAAAFPLVGVVGAAALWRWALWVYAAFLVAAITLRTWVIFQLRHPPLGGGAAGAAAAGVLPAELSRARSARCSC